MRFRTQGAAGGVPVGVTTEAIRVEAGVRVAAGEPVEAGVLVAIGEIG